MKQITNTLLMIRPVAFRMNEQTAVNNYYQKVLDQLEPTEVNAKAQQEFDTLVDKLRAVGVEVIVVDDLKDKDTPDSIFPNNWVSFHEDGTVVLYPMFAPNRRLERRQDILDLIEDRGFRIHQIIDYTDAEKEGYFLEGTGSLLLDRIHDRAYCALSPRAHAGLLQEFCEELGLQPIVFKSFQDVAGQRKLVYHTNVVMCLGEKFAVLCADSIDNLEERKNVLEQLKADGKEIILISEEQVNRFAGNMLQVVGAEEQRYIVMSESAHLSLTAEQILSLEKHGKILSSALDTIEVCGGGSARCMLAKIFLPKF